jgi:integrase
MAVKVREWKGAWWVFIDHQGRRKAKRVGIGKEGKRAAQTAAEKIQAALTLGDLSVFRSPTPEKPVLTLGAFAAEWLKSDVALRLKLSSQETYEQIIRIHLTPVLGSTPLRDLTRDDVKAFLANRTQAGLGPERIRLALNVLCACLNSAVEAGHLPSNPAVRLGRYTEQPDAPLETVEIFTSAELDRLLNTAERQTPDFYPLVLLLARTGLRIGEAMTLQIGDLDFTRREVWVRRTWGTGKRAHGDRAIGSPKSRRLRRVDMSQQLSDVLQRHLGSGRPKPSWRTGAPFRGSLATAGGR